VRITQVNNPPIAAMSHPATADEGSAVTFDGSASTDPDGDVLSHSWNFGNGDTRTGQQVSYRFPNEGTYTVTLTVKDRHGAQKSATGTVTVSNVAPVIATLRDSTVAQGATYDAAGSFTDPGTDTWTATVDYGEGAGVEPLALSGKSFALSHTYRRAGTFTVTVVVRDGASTATQTARVTVANVAPVIAELPATTLQEGETYAVAGSFTDPGTDTWTGTVSFGDEAAGAPSTPLTLSGKSFTLSHRYARAGRYPVTVTITDSDGATATRTTMVTVESVAPTVTPLAAATIVEAGTYAATGSFTDPGLDTWRATVDYGDGSPVAALPLGGVDGKTFALQHRYTRAGRYTVTVVVTEASGATGSATTTVTVENVAPMVAPLPTVPVKEGEDYAVTGSFTDPGTDRWTATVRYGNGSAEAPLALDGKSFALSHRYARYGSYPVTVKVTDSFGGTGTQTAVVTVQNVAPVFAALPAARIDAGDRWTATATFTDPGVNEWTATVDYGDGAGARAVPVSGKGIALAERYDRPGTYTVTLTVNDGEATATTTTTVTVLNVVPAIASLAQATIAEAGTYGATGSFSDRGIDSWTATVDYGDGSSVETLTLGGAEGKAFALSHRYARYGSYTLTVKVTDAYGGAATQTAVVTVDNVVPVVAPFAGATLLVGETYGSAGTFADPGENVWVATANYGDGSATAPLALDGKRFALSFRYTTAGAFKVAVMVRDGRDSAAQTATATVLNPVQGVAVLSDEVSALGIGGAGSQTDAGASGSASVTGPLTQGEVNALLTTLRAASQQGARGNAGAAILQLEAFVNQVAAYERSGRLGASDAARLTAYARRVITSFRV